MTSTARTATTAAPADRLKASEYPPISLSQPVTLVASTRPAKAMKLSQAVALTTSRGGNRLLNTTTSGTQVAAASPVMIRPTRSPFAPSAAPISHAPSPTRVKPTRMNGLRQPSQSAAIPTGSRMIACHRPYIDRIMPTVARLPVLVWA